MPRDLTPEEESKLLPQELVDQLPSMTVVMVKWSGGNGPHAYALVNRNGEAFALRAGDDPAHPAHDFRLSPVGRDPWQVRVWRA